MAWFGSANKDKTTTALAPAPIAPISLLGATPPPDATLAQSNATKAALDAAKRQRKKAAGTLLTSGAIGASATSAPVLPVLSPKTLTGTPSTRVMGAPVRAKTLLGA